jgi:chromate reductase, NAD(P)H dehydrogenase (quinone)
MEDGTASQLAPVGTTVEIASIRGIPLYDGDVEVAEGIPTMVQELKTRIAATDGLLIVTPEYNNSIPGVLKNAFDWLSRPADDIQNVFGGRPVAVIGATPGQGVLRSRRLHGFQSCGRLVQPLGSAAG